MEKTSKGKVFVGMSGGVDSSVSALLLKEAGYDVVGVFIKVWQANFLPCTWRDERRDAMRAAAHIGIPFTTLDLEKEYKEEVVDYMIREYKAGRVPNPDVMCNKYVKFGGFLTFAKEHGADYIATGHYARIRSEDGKHQLLTGVDREKDQSYFLWTLSEDVLGQILFPIGEMEKSEVRTFAAAKGLPNAEKKDSQGLCFMGPVDMEDFLKHYIKCKKGEVRDESGQVIGEHGGAMLYTIGQRHGFTTLKQSPNDEPYFVIAKHIETNGITVGHRDPRTESGKRDAFDITEVLLRGSEYMFGGKFSVRIRYRGELHPAHLEKIDGGWKVKLQTALSDISPGQSVVFYGGDTCIGGGVIAGK